MQTVAFWFEFASTYSYLAATRVARVAAHAGVAVAYRPFLLGPIFKDQGWNDSPFNVYPAKGRYMWRDMERLTADLGVPFRRPSQFPRNGLLAARVALVVRRLGLAERFVPRVYEENFANDRDIGDAAVIADILTSLDLSPDAVLLEARTEAIKRELRESTDEARRLGIFGAPTFTVGDELFWGNERLDQALDWASRSTSTFTSTMSGACGFANDF